jgi:hypothetical protein
MEHTHSDLNTKKIKIAAKKMEFFDKTDSFLDVLEEADKGKQVPAEELLGKTCETKLQEKIFEEYEFKQ